jgi:hypothetical protein
MPSKNRCHFERRFSTRFASAGAESRNLLFADVGIDACTSTMLRRRLSGIDCLSDTSKQQVPRLHKIVRHANDLASLGMTLLRERAARGAGEAD